MHQALKPPSSDIDIDIDVSRSSSPGSGDASPVSGRLSRIAVVGTEASQLLMRVIEPLLSPDIDKTSVENGIFFKQVLQSEGINTLWKHNEGLSFQALDCRELLFKEKGCTQIREENPYQTWTSLSSVACPLPTTTTTTTTAASQSKSVSSGHQRPPKIKRVSRPVSPVTSALFADGFRVASTAARGQKEKEKEGKEKVTVSDAVLNAMRQQQREAVYQLCGGDSGSSKLSVVAKDADGSDKWSLVPRSTSRASEQGPLGHCEEKDPQVALRSNLKFPILLIRKCHSAANSNADADHGLLPLCLRGWDLLIPEQHCNSVWQALQYAGGRSIGLEERAVVSGALSEPSFPRDFPDSAAGREYWKRWRTTNHVQNKNRPVRKRKQNKRLERVPNLKSLFEDEYGGDSSLLRSVTDLVVMRNVEFARPFFPPQLLLPRQHDGAEYTFAASLQCSTAQELDTTDREVVLPQLPFPTLIRIYLSASGRGVPHCGAELFQPLREDYERWLAHRRHRSEATTTPNRKWGDWHGENSAAAGRGRRPDERNGGRMLVGLVSSALQPDLFRPEKGAIAFCEAGKLSQMVASSTYIVKSGKRSEVVPLFMYRNPLSDIFRPALFYLCLS